MRAVIPSEQVECFLTPCSHDTFSNQRWVWLSVKAPDSNKSHEYYVPESVIRCIPLYKQQLDEKLATAQDKFDILISDTVDRPRKCVTQTIRYLTTGYLRPLDIPYTVRSDLLELVYLYRFSKLLSIKRLESGILAHIDGFKNISIPIFLAGARFHYGIGGDRESSLGQLIKKRLAELLPQMIELRTVDEIKTEGGILAQQLMEVLLEKVIASETKQLSAPDHAILIKDEHPEE